MAVIGMHRTHTGCGRAAPRGWLAADLDFMSSLLL